MQIFLIRHAVAEPRSPEVEEHERALTPRGRKRFKRAARGLGALHVDFDRLYTSPWKRAAQTADLVAKLLRGERVETPLLTKEPGAELLAQIRGERVAVVGHDPWLPQLAALLLLGNTAQAERFAIKKGGVAILEGEAAKPGALQLKALYEPAVLRRLGR